MKAAFENILVKISFIVLLILILIVPTFMVEQLIKERNNRQEESIQEVSENMPNGSKCQGQF